MLFKKNFDICLQVYLCKENKWKRLVYLYYRLWQYLLLKEYIETGHPICLPELKIYFKASTSIIYVEDNFFDYIGFERLHQYDTEIQCSNKTRVFFDCTEIVYSGDRPTALIASKSKSKLAIIVKPPASVCKEVFPKKYKDYSTVVLDLSYYDYELSNSKKDEIFSLLQSDKIYYWVYSKKAINGIPAANKKNEEYRAYCEKREKEDQAEKARIAEKKRKEKEKREALLSSLNSSSTGGSHMPSREAPKQEIPGYEMVAIRKKDFSQKELIRDSLGRRWVKCKQCQKVFREDKAFSIDPDTNFGLCNICK